MDRNEVSGLTSLCQAKQQKDPPELKELLNIRIEYCCELIDGEKADDDEDRLFTYWCEGVIKEVSNGEKNNKKWIIPGRARAGYKSGEAALIEWQPLYADEEITTSIVKLDQRLWNKQVHGAWRKHFE